MYSVSEKLRASIEKIDLNDIESFSVDNTQKLFSINFKGQQDNFVIVYYDDKYELLKDLQGLQFYLENELKQNNQQLDKDIKSIYYRQSENTNDYAKRNIMIGALTFLGNVLSIASISNFQFLLFISSILVVDAIGATSVVINKKIQKKNEDKLFDEKRSLERTKQQNIIDFKRLANSLKQVALKVKYNEKDDPADSFDFTLSIENYFSEEKDKILHFTI